MPETDDLRRTVDALQAEVHRLTDEVERWRAQALRSWSEAAAASDGGADAELLAAELAAVHASLSWRVTRPLRALRRLVPR